MFNLHFLHGWLLSLEAWDAVKGALVGVATRKLSGVIEELLPGFKQEFTKAQTSNPG
jgi:hypothetical protein